MVYKVRSQTGTELVASDSGKVENVSFEVIVIIQ